ncbi:MAG TPA: hypothetical protein VFX22_02320, partial [Candidatus Kapabacteria bacterium]|nr:hypothetical protein [Candidatus Kapabacteria bacterium]
DKQTLQAAMYGPLVLAARFEEEPREKWYRNFRAEEKQEPVATLPFKGKLNDPASWLEPAGGKLAFRTTSHDQNAAFVPLSSLMHERYSVYHEIHEENS